MLKNWIVVLSLAACANLSGAPSFEPLLLQSPTLSQTQIAFAYGGEIWIVGRNGGDAQRLVTGSDRLGGPFFSPDGTTIAYTGDYDSNLDVYVVPAAGGDPRRLTYHPGTDTAVGWTPDGKSVLFVSARARYADPAQFFTVPAGGGFPTELPLPMGANGSYSPDGTHLAYLPYFQWEPEWKQYHGGQNTPIWIANLADSSTVAIPGHDNNDKNPMWAGQTVYFLSDRNGPVTLFAYDVNTKKVTEVVHNTGFDIKSAGVGPGGIVYAQFGSLHLYDFATRAEHEIHVRIAADMPQLRPHFEKLNAGEIKNGAISPTGKRAVFEAHGEIYTAPADKGDIRNLTRSPAVADRDPAWSPDGKSIAWFSDESGEYALHIRDQHGLEPVRAIPLGQPPSYYYSPTWSPDSHKIAYSDTRLNLWSLDVTNGSNGTPVKVDADYYDEGPSPFNISWSADSHWLAYNRALPNHLHAIFVYSLETKKATQITDGMSDARYPAFDHSGKYLYFVASTDFGLTAGDSDMSGIERPVTFSAYAVVLRTNIPSPLAPESDEEKVVESTNAPATNSVSTNVISTNIVSTNVVSTNLSLTNIAKTAVASTNIVKTNSVAQAEKKEKTEKVAEAKPGKKEEKKPETPVATNSIDFENIDQRIIALPIPARNYMDLRTGKDGIVFLAEGPPMANAQGGHLVKIYRFDLEKRSDDKILDGVGSFALSADGEKMLYRKDGNFYINDSSKEPGGGGQIKLDGMEVNVDPRAEWRQMYHEVWRIERDFFYDPHFHGLDLQKAERVYAPFLDRVASRDDLTELFGEMTGNLVVGHMFVRGGTEPEVKTVNVGLLGADYEIVSNRYRFQRIFSGQNWNPDLQAPLTQPGVNVKVGDYLLAVNGRDLTATNDIYEFFEETSGQQTVLKVGPKPDGGDSRDVTVLPVGNEFPLRNLAWIEGNRRKVDEMTVGRVAYVYLPDTMFGGYKNFNRYYFSQTDKQAAIIDERFNHGGWLADYIVDYLRRPILNKVATREGHDLSEPLGIYGPKVMVINQFAGSGGDALPWYFRKLGVGPLVGNRTWGGLIGIGGYPDLLDGGGVTAPRWAIYGLNGQWEVENHGVAPDYDVTMDPKRVREGHDPQLEKAVEVVLDLLKKNPPKDYPRPPYPDYHQKLPPSP